jgi:hypothetical protein
MTHSTLPPAPEMPESTRASPPGWSCNSPAHTSTRCTFVVAIVASFGTAAPVVPLTRESRDYTDQRTQPFDKLAPCRVN